MLFALLSLEGCAPKDRQAAEDKDSGEACPVGTYRTSDTCLPCEDGTFSDKEDSSSCQPWSECSSATIAPGTATSDTQCSASTQIISIASGNAHSCALFDTGAIKCWGSNSAGQLGSGNTSSTSLPVDVSLPIKAIQITAGSTHSCAILEDHSMMCWGNNTLGQLGDRTTLDSSVPVRVALPLNAKILQMSAGKSHTCALLEDTSIMCWGLNSSFQVNDEKTLTFPTPQLAPPAFQQLKTTQIALGGEHSCARFPEGTAACWGSDVYSQQGTAATTGRALIVLPVGITIAQIASGGSHSCYISQLGSVMCWGKNDEGQLGTGKLRAPFDIETAPTATILLAGRVTQLSLGEQQSYALLEDGTIQSWGNNSAGQLGNGDYTTSASPASVMLPTGESAVQVASGKQHSCALTKSNAVFC